jgi:putative transposase
MTRHRSPHVGQRDERLLPRRQARKAAHPCWGYRRLWAYLRVVAQLPVNKKRSWRLRPAPRLRVPPHLRLKAPRSPSGSQPKPTTPTPWWGIEMTKVLVAGVGWVSIGIVRDW